MDADIKYAVEIIVSPKLNKKLSEERILMEEIADTIEFCERTGRRIKLIENDTYSGYHKIGHMTYWVEYRPKGSAFELINAYSHRMEINLEAVWNGRKVDTYM